MPNDLVAPVQPLTMPEDGIMVADFAIDAGRAISNGDWLEGGIALGAAGLDALALVADPFGTLLTSAFAWAMEHVDPLPEMLNCIAGNPDVVQANATTWANIANHLRTTSEDMERIVNQDSAPWQGPAIDSYRLVAIGEAKLIAAAGIAADAVSAAVSGAGIAVSVVRTTVRDLIASAMSDIVQWLARAVAAMIITVGLATPALIADVIRIVAKWSKRVSDWLDKIVSAIRKLSELVQKIKPVLQKVKDVMEPIQKAAKASPLSSLTPAQQAARNTAVIGGTYDDQAAQNT